MTQRQRDQFNFMADRLHELQLRNSDLILCISKAYMLAPEGTVKTILEEYAEIIKDESTIGDGAKVSILAPAINR